MREVVLVECEVHIISMRREKSKSKVVLVECGVHIISMRWEKSKKVIVENFPFLYVLYFP